MKDSDKAVMANKLNNNSGKRYNSQRLLSSESSEENRRDAMSRNEAGEDNKQQVFSSSGTEGASDKGMHDESREEIITCTC